MSPAPATPVPNKYAFCGGPRATCASTIAVTIMTLVGILGTAKSDFIGASFVATPLVGFILANSGLPRVHALLASCHGNQCWRVLVATVLFTLGTVYGVQYAASIGAGNSICSRLPRKAMAGAAAVPMGGAAVLLAAIAAVNRGNVFGPPPAAGSLAALFEDPLFVYGYLLCCCAAATLIVLRQYCETATPMQEALMDTEMASLNTPAPPTTTYHH